MNINQAFLRHVTSVEAVAAITDRMYSKVLPQNEQGPALTYSRSDTQTTHSFAGKSGLTRVEFDLSAWSQRDEQAQSLADAVQAALDGYTGLMDVVRVYRVEQQNRIDSHEADTGLHRVAMTFTCWYHEE